MDEKCLKCEHLPVFEGTICENVFCDDCVGYSEFKKGNGLKRKIVLLRKSNKLLKKENKELRKCIDELENECKGCVKEKTIRELLIEQAYQKFTKEIKEIVEMK